MARGPVTSVTAPLFEEGWTRKNAKKVGRARVNSRHIGRARQMTRAASGSRAAMFKLIRTGGCKTSGQLKSQLAYLFSKSESVIDSAGTYENRRMLTSSEVNEASERWAGDWRGETRAGHSSHMVMSFPIGTTGRQVQAITEELCEQKFGGRFDYIAAVHTDRAHPHAHIVVNRRNSVGEFFTLRRDSEFSYESFKEAMIEIGAKHGVHMEAATRLERGIATYPPSKREIYAAKDEGRAASDRERKGADLLRAQVEIGRNSEVYRLLAEFAEGQGELSVAASLERASSRLQQGQIISPSTKEQNMTAQQRFDAALNDLEVVVGDAEKHIASLPADQRPQVEKKLNDIVVELSDLAPSAASARELKAPPSTDGVYSEQNSRAAAIELDRKGSAALSESLRGTGIDPAEVEARMRVGASNAALERQWLAEDIRAIADSQGLDLSSDEQFERALREVDRVHDKIASDYGIDAAIAQRERAAEQVDVAAGSQSDRDRAAEQAEARGRGSVPTSERRASKQDLANMHEPVGEEDERRFKAAVEERLTPEELAQLKRGDVSVLDGVGDRETQLTIAKSYLKAEGNSRDAYRSVSDELIDMRAAARQKAREERGVEHG